MSKVAIVTGGTSGIGLQTALSLRNDHGYAVYVFSRHDFYQEGLNHVRCDVSSEEAVTSAAAEVINREGRLDLVVNCAGMGISGALEFTDPDDAKRLFDVNFFGTVNVNKACLAHLRATRGRIINISSVAAVVPIPFQSFYSASKAAINSYSLALANELKPFGVEVCAVMPGDTATGFTAARKKSEEGDDLYQGRISRSVAKMEKDEIGGHPESSAALIYDRLQLQAGKSVNEDITGQLESEAGISVICKVKAVPPGNSFFVSENPVIVTGFSDTKRSDLHNHFFHPFV